MESRIEIDEQYNDDMRDTRTLRQKVSILLVPYYLTHVVHCSIFYIREKLNQS